MPARLIRDRLEESLSRIADPKGEGARACLTVYQTTARLEADAADAISLLESKDYSFFICDELTIITGVHDDEWKGR